MFPPSLIVAQVPSTHRAPASTPHPHRPEAGGEEERGGGLGDREYDQTAEAVTSTLRELDEIGYTDVIVRNLVADQAKAVGCIEGLADVKKSLQ